MSETVLAVDDSEMMRTVVKQTLQLGSHNVILADDGKDALQKYEENKDKITLIVSDVNMPVMNGIEFVSKLRKRNEEIPILMLTTESDEDLQKKGMNAGADGWIVKPFQPAQFLDIIKQITE